MVGITALGCSSKTQGKTVASVYVAPTDLPPGFRDVLFGCAQSDEDGRAVLTLGYRSDDRYRTEARSETALLRVFALEGARSDEVLEHADSGSVKTTNVHGEEAWRYTVTSAEPVPTAWPALAWQEGDVTIEVVGEGLDAAAVKLVADGIESISKDEFEMLVPEQRC